LSADYKATARIRTAVGYDHDSRTRTYQEVNTTREDTVWGKVVSHAMDKVDLTLKLAHGERGNSGYQVVPMITPAENPLLRKYNMADRTRNSAGLRAEIAATERINIGLGIDASKDDYTASTLGLTDDRDISLNGDVTLILTEQTSLHLFANREEIKSTQVGSQTFSTPDWSGDNRDIFYFVGVGVKHAAIKDKLDVGADLSTARSWSQINVNTGAPNPAFPELSTTLDSLKLYANYRLKENMSLQAGYWYQRFDSANWMLDGVTPGTIPNVLSLGEQSPRYHVNLFRLSVKYKF
jgi:MtrB/PioB family decaheme-associated outer membrane protein